LINTFIENRLEGETTTGTQRNEHSSRRKAYRNDHYLRNFLLKYGLIDAVRVPRFDQGGINFMVFDRYERRFHDVDAAGGRLFLNGISALELNRLHWLKEAKLEWLIGQTK